MIFVKALLLLAGGGAVAGVTYSQTQKNSDSKSVVVSNNHESTIRARFEKKLNIDLLTNKKNHLTQRQKTYTQNINTKKNALDAAQAALKKAYDDLNNAKNELNTISNTLIGNYTSLTTHSSDLKDKLIEKMSDDLEKENKKWTKAFYDAQKETYEKERSAIIEKIKKIDTTSSINDNNACNDKSENWTPTNTSTSKTTEESKIESELEAELSDVCKGLSEANSKITENAESKDNSKSTSYTTAKSTRDATITTIRDETNKYNSKIINIKSKEFDVKSKLLSFQNAQSDYRFAQETLQKTTNELELVSEKISN